MPAAGNLRFTIRTMRANPGFTAIATVSLALGIGANTAIFSLIDQLLLWSLPARDPGGLVKLAGGYCETYPFYREYRDRNQVFTTVFASSHHLAAGLRPEGSADVEVGHVHYVSGAYFEGLGIGAAAGRLISPADDAAPGGSPVAVLSYGYWQRRLGGDARVVGRLLSVNGHPLAIAGIAQKGFGGIYNGDEADAFVPLTMYPVTTPASARVWNTPNMHWLENMARLKPGVPIGQAEASLRVLWSQTADAVNAALEKDGLRRRNYRENPIKLEPGARGPGAGGRETADPLATLAIATGMVLLIACANVANLLLARATGRRREIAVRLAIGATRARLIRQLLGEGLVLSAGGAVLGLVLAWAAVAALAGAGILEPDFRFRPSLPVLAFCAGVTVLTALLFSLMPAFRATRMTLASAIKDGGSSSQSGARLRLGKALIAGQVALALTLLAGAGLFIRTLRNLQRIDLGFERERVLIFDVDPTNVGYQGHRLRAFYDQLADRVRRIPGVQSAGLASMMPMGDYLRSSSFSVEGRRPAAGERLVALTNPVSTGYFATLGTRLLLGRDFRPEDEPAVTPDATMMAALGRSSGNSNDSSPHASRVCIIDESLARNVFGEANPVGLHLGLEDRYTPETAVEIVGVVKDIHYSSVKTADRFGTIYEPSWSNGAEVRWLSVRATGAAAGVIDGVRREVRSLDANVPVMRVRTMVEYVDGHLQRERLIAFVSGLFGALALGLAAAGLYGVMAYSVTQRTREVGIRMALGADRGEVIGMIVRESSIPVLAGVAIGVAGAWAVGRAAASRLYGIAPHDGVTILAAVAAMVAISLLAAAIPARTASRVDPVRALRWE